MAARTLAGDHGLRVDWGLAIRKRRRALELTQDALGRKIGVAGVTVSHWERGIASPSYARLSSIARALGEDPNTFFVFPEDDAPKRKRVTSRRRRTNDEGG